MDISPEGLTKEDGLQLLKAGRVDEAVAAFQNAQQASPQDPQVHAYLGAAYNLKGDHERAVGAFEESLGLQKTPKAHYNLGLAYESVQRMDDATAQYRMALELDPSYAPAVEAMKKFDSAPMIAPEPTMVGATMPSVGAGPEPTVMDVQPDFNAVFAQPTAPPDLSREAYEREQRFAEQRKAYIKSGVIYGAICGAGFLFALQLALTFLFGTLAMTYGASAGPLIVGLIISFVKGGIMGGIIGLWIGYTCGGDMQGLLAGALMGAVYALVTGLVAGFGAFVILPMLWMAFLGAMFGYIVGKMVESSIGGL